MHEAGNGKHIADKFRSQSLRVIAVDRDGRYHEGSEAKWKYGGANFPLYNRLHNCFGAFYKDVTGYPSHICVKEWKGKKIIGYESEIKDMFDFN